MDKITRVLFSDIGKAIIQHVELPHQELKSQEARVTPMSYGVCGSDLHVLGGGHPFTKPPVVPGHEVVVRVTEVDSEIVSIKPDDHAVIDPIMTYMKCYTCKAGRFNLCGPSQVTGFRMPGSARSQYIVPVRDCHVVPASLPLKALAFAELATCARHCMSRIPKVSLESVLVIDAGATGLSIVQALRIVDVGKIIVIEPNAARRALSLGLGATEVWALGELNVQVRFTGIIDAVTAQAILNGAFTRVYVGGTVVCMKVPSDPRETPLPVVRRFERDLLNSGMYIPEDFDAMIGQLAGERFDISELVIGLFPVEDTDKVFERAQQNDSIKAMLQFAEV